MIRFIDISDQISGLGIEGEKHFAFYNTIRSEFFGWPNSYVWTDWDDFTENYELYKNEIDTIVFSLSRFRSLVPQEKGWGK